MSAASRRIGLSRFRVVFPLGATEKIVDGLVLEPGDMAVMRDLEFVGIVRKGLPRCFDADVWSAFVAACKDAKEAGPPPPTERERQTKREKIKEHLRTLGILEKIQQAGARLDAHHRGATP
jgi:hypothetical protein